MAQLLNSQRLVNSILTDVVLLPILVFTLLVAIGSCYTWQSHMSCFYGPRGALTAICVNATANYLKLTNYRFDYLDETLICLNCSLKALEYGTFDLPGNEVKTLDIRNSSITKIWPKAFLGMIYMEKLLLSHNPIEVIYPEAFLGVRKVKYLDMEDTVSNLEPKVFRELYVLEVLILTKNRLQEIKPGTFEGLHNLRILDLSENELKSVNHSFDPLINLKVLKLKNNFIKKLYGDEFNELKALNLLNLDNNVMINFTTNLAPNNQLRTLSLAFNYLDVNSFRPNTFSNLNYLEELNLNNNNFENITVKLFQGLYRLRVLNLSYNKMTTINTGSFAGLPYMRELNFSKNSIHTLKVTGRFTLPSLVILDISDNNIVDLDYMSLVIRTPRLKHIHLQSNKLSCKTVRQLETLFENDGVSYFITDVPDMSSCPRLDKSAAAQLMEQYAEKLESQYFNSSLLIWMFILFIVVILLLGVLFYVQFFIVMRMGSGSSKRMRILRNLGFRRTDENV